MIKENNKFTFIAPIYNASSTLHMMLFSIIGQSYNNWQIILIDDCSTSTEVGKEHMIIHEFKKLLENIGKNPDQIKIVWNHASGRGKRWETDNVLYGLTMCKDNDIVARIDGDDWLTDLDSLQIINSAYEQTNCDVLWTAHRWGFSDKNISGPMKDGDNAYKSPWVSSHLKTFRRHLLNDVPYENFLNMNGELAKRCGDQAIYLPCLHHAKQRVFLPRVIYHYTIDEQDGAVYQTDDAKFQKQEADFIRSRGYISSGITWEQQIKK